MKKVLLSISLILGVPVTAWAQVPFEILEVIGINASPEKVWNAVKNFDDLHSWNPQIVKTEIIEGEATVPGAVRLVTLESNDTLKEKLTVYEPAEMKLSYEIVEASFVPVHESSSALTVTSTGDGISTVQWQGTYNTDTAADAKVASEALMRVYVAGLGKLKVMLEGP